MKLDVVVGIDEVGRGPLAGPVVIAAYIVPLQQFEYFIELTKGIKDSKKLSQNKRAKWIETLLTVREFFAVIKEQSADEIDEQGISWCLKQCIIDALEEISQKNTISKVYLDGSLYAPLEYEQETIIKGDESHPIISVASIFAKQYRDTKMRELAKEYPKYGFESHVGYGTKQHYAAIEEYGIISTVHRISFLKKILQG